MWGSNPSLLRQRVLSNFQSSAVAAKSLQSYSTLCIPMDSNPPGSSVHWILQTRMLEWVAIPFSRGSFWPRDWTQVSYTAGRFFTSWATREVGGIYVNTVCQPLLPAWLWGFLMCSLGCFFRGNSESHSCRFCVSMGGGKFRIFLHYHLEWEPL